MKKNIIIWIIVGVILVALMVLAANISTLKGNNKTLEITKEINAGIPFKWEYVIEDPNIVEFKKSYVIRDDNKGGLVGGNNEQSRVQPSRVKVISMFPYIVKLQ